MTTFILNNQQISTGMPGGISLLDFIRDEAGLMGTKSGCREGDCGACTVLMGTPGKQGTMRYISIVSCLTPLANAHGKHIVTIEGLNMNVLSPAQKVIVDHSATQCGFCTPGFVMSLTAACMSGEVATSEKIIEAMSGNICRCTGYNPMIKAADDLAHILKNKDNDDPVSWLVKEKYLPAYFNTIPARLSEIVKNHPPFPGREVNIAGGTDLMVQRADELAEKNTKPLTHFSGLSGITVEKGRCRIGAATTFTEIKDSSLIKDIIPSIDSYLKLVASEQVRNTATVGGNIVNASPIGDMTIMLLALGAALVIEGPAGTRTVLLKDFYHGYKQTDLHNDEIINHVVFNCFPATTLFNFEKVSKREHLDIAGVNSAILISIRDETIRECSLSAGGVGPVPLYLKKTSDYLIDKPLTTEILIQADRIMQEEISPISDIRGSADYKRLLLRQLLFTHFLKLFPGRPDLKIVAP